MALEAEGSNPSIHPIETEEGKHLFLRHFFTGVSPSGKATDFDSVIPLVRIQLPQPKVKEPPILGGSFLCVHLMCTFYLILFKTDTARSSSRGYKWLYVFHVISIFEWPNRRAIS